MAIPILPQALRVGADPQRRDPVRRRFRVTIALIAVNVMVFVAGPGSGVSPFFGSGFHAACASAEYYWRYAAVPRELLSGHALPHVPAMIGGVPCPTPGAFRKVPMLSVLTAMFVHANWLHIGGNMLFLYVFGNNVEDRLGRLRFLVFYLVSGYVATYGYALSAMHSTQQVLGASGAIAGTLGAYLFLFPRAKVIGLVPFLFFLPLRFPAWVVLGFWFFLQWLAFQQQGAGVAYGAHVVGFLAGLAYAWLRFGRATWRSKPPARPEDTSEPAPSSGPERATCLPSGAEEPGPASEEPGPTSEEAVPTSPP